MTNLLCRCTAFALLLLSPFAAWPEESQLAVGVFTELTGPGAQVGNECRAGLEFGNKILGNRLRLVFEDTKEDPVHALSALARMVRLDGIKAAAVTRSRIAIPLSPAAVREGIPMVAGVGHPEILKLNPGAVRLFPSAALEGRVLSEAAIRRNIKSVFVVSTEDDWTLALAESFVRNFQRAGGSVSGRMTFRIQDDDTASVVTRIRTSKPDALFVNLLGNQSGTLVKQARQQGYEGRILSNFWIQHPGTIASAGIGPLEGALFAQLNIERPKFSALFRSQYPTVPITPTTYLCYAAAALFGETCGEDVCRPERLTSIESISLLDEVIPFVNREPELQLIIKELRDGKPRDAEV